MVVHRKWRSGGLLRTVYGPTPRRTLLGGIGGTARCRCSSHQELSEIMPGLLEFDPTTHTYRVDGVRYPSVTQVLERVGIIDYSYIPAPTREMALARGSAVHAWTAHDDRTHQTLDLDALAATGDRAAEIVCY